MKEFDELDPSTWEDGYCSCKRNYKKMRLTYQQHLILHHYSPRRLSI